MQNAFSAHHPDFGIITLVLVTRLGFHKIRVNCDCDVQIVIHEAKFSVFPTCDFVHQDRGAGGGWMLPNLPLITLENGD